ncbi:MAG TPA: hypothetical protein VJ853_02775 [Thermoanaerobaculia bacterium]|nr:hypothetical protein [Thermoanaerobaculia bacterium]
MPLSGVVAFFAVFIAVVAFIFIAGARQQKRWRARPAILRAFAQRRGYSVVEKPGKPSELVPIRPLEQGPNVEAIELPLAVRGRTLDADFTLFDVYKETNDHAAGHASHHESFETFLTINSGRSWPHFEFAVVHLAEGSFGAALVEMAAALAQSRMNDRGLVRVPIPDRPGYELFVAPDADAAAIRDVLVPLFDNRGSWWIGGLGDAVTLQRRDSKSVTQGTLIAEKDLDRFIDEAFEIERAARGAIRP